MKIAEIFYSIQGEGKLAGTPSVFIRTSGCNLRCAWCDTPYASWSPEGVDMEPAQIVELALRHPSRYVVLTGGEPMIAPGVHELAARLREAGCHITIETAATIPPAAIACDLASLSPKLANSRPAGDPAWARRHESARWQPAVLRDWLRHCPYQLKFVVSQPDDLDEIRRCLRELGQPVEAGDILLMPEATTPEALLARQNAVAEMCKAEGWRYCDRLHLRLYGATRGT